MAHFKKLEANGWATKPDALSNMKAKWKVVFESRSAEIFNANPELWKGFNRVGGGKIEDLEDLEDFEELLNHDTFNIGHELFTFIKVE